MHGLAPPNESLFHLDAGLGSALFVLVFVWAVHVCRGNVMETKAAGWWAVAFLISLVEHVLAATMEYVDGSLLHGYLHGFSLVHTLEPILLYAGLRALHGRDGPGVMMPTMISLGVGWVGAAMVATLSLPWVLAPVHLLRGVMLFIFAYMAWRSVGKTMERPLPSGILSAVAAANAVVAFAVAAAIGLGAESLVILAMLEATLYGLLGLVLAIRLLGGPGALARRSRQPVWPRDVLNALDAGVLDVDADRKVTWANQAAATLFGVRDPDGLTGVTLETLLPSWGETPPDARSSRHDVRVIEGRDRRGQALTVRATCLGSLAGLDGGAPAGNDDMLVLVQTPDLLLERDAASLVAMARLFQDMDRLVRSGESQQAICRAACVLLADLTDAPTVWVAMGYDRHSLRLIAAAGADSVLLSDQIGRPLTPLLRSLVDPALDLGTPQAVPVGGPDPAALLVTEASQAGDASGRGGGDTTAFGDSGSPGGVPQGPAAVAPMVCCGRMVGVLVVHGRSAPPDRLVRLRAEAVAQHLLTATDAARDTAFLRLQAQAMTVAANATLITDRDGTIVWVNEAFKALSGFSAADVCGRTPDMLTSGQQDPETSEEMWSTVRTGRNWDGELVERRKDGTLYTVRQTVTPLRETDGTVTHFVFVHEDITDHKRAEERVRYLSNYDTLTRLPNRTLFRDRLYQAVQHARRTQGTVAVLFVDLAQFSRVNDTMGHDVGDQILMTIGSRLNAAVAEEVDTVARMGGDEFAIIQTGRSGAELAANLARRVARIIETPVEVGQQAVSVRANVGIAMYPDDGPDPDNLIKNADLAMYRVIRSEGETYRFYSNEMNDDAQARLALEADLRRALERRELVNYYQPQYDISGTLVGMEALVRWLHPTRGLVSPGAFIPVAEESGLILSLGDRVLRQALADVAAWRASGLPLVPVSVNISAAQFAQTDLVDHIRAALEQHGLPPDALELELTESMLMREGEVAIGFLGQLADLGIRIAIDDFGTGYSSLSYLKRFPVHKLKIDKAFVRHVNDDTNDTIIVRAIINLGHSLGMSVVAEGVETEEQFDYLRGEGADVVQGFLFSRPLPHEEMERVLRVEFGRLSSASARAAP